MVHEVVIGGSRLVVTDKTFAPNKRTGKSNTGLYGQDKVTLPMGDEVEFGLWDGQRVKAGFRTFESGSLGYHAIVDGLTVDGRLYRATFQAVLIGSKEGDEAKMAVNRYQTQVTFIDVTAQRIASAEKARAEYAKKAGKVSALPTMLPSAEFRAEMEQRKQEILNA